MPRVAAIILIGRHLEFLHLGKGLVIGLHEEGPGLDETLQLSELMDPDRGLNVGEVVLESRAQYLVIPIPAVRITVPRILTDPVQAQDLQRISQGFVIRSYHTSFARSQVF